MAVATSAERAYRVTNRIWDRLRSPLAIESANAEPSGTIDDLRGHRYCVVITCRPDGTPAPTALWFGLRDGRVYLRTGASTAKLHASAATPR